MAILRRGKDGHYFVRGAVHIGAGAQRVATWQVEPAGVGFLARHGVGVDDQVPQDLWILLYEEELVWTYGSGLGVDSGGDMPAIGEDPRNLPLVVGVDDHSWTLALLLPEIPAAWLQALKVASAATELGAFGLEGPGRRVAAVELWPSRGGVAVPVQPQAKPYAVAPWGTWPSGWDLGRWTCGATRLDPTGTWFRGPQDGAVRLASATGIRLGTNYLLLAAEGSAEASRTTLSFVRLGGRATKLGMRHGWTLWDVQLPQHRSDALNAWCLSIGRRLLTRAWLAAIVSPSPHRYRIDGTPVYRIENELILSVTAPSGATTVAPLRVVLDLGSEVSDCIPLKFERAGETKYLRLQVLAAAEGRVRSVGAQERIASARFAVECQPLTVPMTDLSGMPHALRVTLGNAESPVHEITAFQDEEGLCHVVGDPPGASSTNSDIEVSCLIPLTLAWRHGTLMQRRTNLTPTDAAAQLRELARISRETRTSVLVELDAGAFGRTALAFDPSVASRDTPVLQDQPTDAASRWLAAVGVGLSQRLNAYERSAATALRLVAPGWTALGVGKRALTHASVRSRVSASRLAGSSPGHGLTSHKTADPHDAT
jgi:hypothetical protein